LVPLKLATAVRVVEPLAISNTVPSPLVPPIVAVPKRSPLESMTRAL